VRAVGYSERGNGVMYDDRWTIQQARDAIEQGHVLYVLDPSTGERTELELEDGNIGALDDLPPCG
jgi:hypothetical protein